MEYTWVIARYTYNSERGKSALAHANAGIGYVLMNPERGRADDILVAFKWALNKPIPHHLDQASEVQIERLEKRR